MKPIFTHLLLLAAALLPASASALTVSDYPYTPAAYTTAAGWSASGTAGTWSLGTNYVEASIGSGPSNAWLFSPALELKGGYLYTFTAKIEATSSSYPVSICDVMLLPVAQSTAEPVVTFGNVTTSADKMAIVCTYEYAPEEDCTVYYTVHNTTNGSDRGWYTRFSNFNVTEEMNLTLPNPVKDFTATRAADNSLNVDLSWTLPTTYNTGEPLTIASLELSRDGEHIKTLAADATSYTDAVPAPGIYSYSIFVKDAEGLESASANAKTEYVGTFDGFTPPHTFDLGNTELNTFWQFTTDGESNEWILNAEKAQMSVSLSATHPIDATAISPALNLEKDKAYRVKFNYMTLRKANAINLAFLLAGADGDAIDLIAPMMPCDPGNNNMAEPVEAIFSPAADGQYTLQWHATGLKQAQSYYENTLTVKDISIEEIPVVPMPATDLSVAAGADGAMTATLTWTNPTESETGITLAGELTATIYRDGEEIASVPSTGTYTDEDAAAGYHTYSVVISNANGSSDMAAPTARSPFIGPDFDVPFVSDFETESALFLALEYGDKANGKTFTFANGKAVISEKFAEVSDALLTPPLKLYAGHAYKFTVNSNVSSYSSNKFDLVLTSKETPDVLDNVIGSGSSERTAADVSAEFSVPEDGVYYLAYKALTASYGSSEYQIYINSMKVEESGIVPLAAADAKAAGQNDKIEISWTMPVEATLPGLALAETLTAQIYRGTAVAEDDLAATVEGAPGAECSWVDSGVEAGIHSYTIVIVNPDSEGYVGGTSEAVTVKSNYVGIPVTLPLISDFATEEGRSLWTIIDNSSTKGKTFEFTDDDMLCVDENQLGSSRLDDWIVSPLIRFDSDDTYTVEIEAKGNNSTFPKFEIYVGAEPTAVALQVRGQKIAPATSLTAEFVTYSYEFTYAPEVSAAAVLDDEPETPDANVSSTTGFVGLRVGCSQYCNPVVTVKSFIVKSAKEIVGVGSVSAAEGMVVSSGLISAPGMHIELYSVAGNKVAEGTDSLSTSSILPGVYVAVATDGKTRLTSKFIK